MNELPDKTVIVALIATILLIFGLIFSTRPPQENLQPSIQWREASPDILKSMEI